MQVAVQKNAKVLQVLPIEEQRVLRKDPKKIVSKARYSSRVKPKLNKLDYL